MKSCQVLIAIFCAALIAETLAAPSAVEDPIIVRSKRQQCRCVKNPNGGLTCSCAKGPANGGSSNTYTAQHDAPQSADIANQLTAIQQQQAGHQQARCGCIQIVFQGAPQYNCQCADMGGQSLPTTTTTTMAPTTTTSTTTTTTTPQPTTTTTPQVQVPTQTQGSNNGACNCVMISISSPQTAQYQCQCAGQQAAAQIQHDDYTQTFHTQPTTTPTTTTTTSTTTQAPTTTQQQVMYAEPTTTQYPLTTTCVMYVNVPTTACSCLPQYDQCAQNVCCLKAKYRSYKKTEETAPSTIDMLMNVLKTIKTKLE